MSYGKMNTIVDIEKPTITTDEDGFCITTDEVLATVRAYREGRHGSERWANRAAFTDATDLFQMREVSKLVLTNGYGSRVWRRTIRDHLCGSRQRTWDVRGGAREKS